MRLVLLLTALFICSMTALAQTRKVSGQVKDNKGQVVPFATISEVGTSNAVQADENGNYIIVVKPGARITVSAVGYQPKTLTADTDTLQFTLTAGEAQMQEVVVTALGIKREKRALTYATQTIGSDQLSKSGLGNPLSELEGKAAGLTVINSAGDPGAGTYIRLRGVTSITGDNQPLMVIDGVPVDNSINNYDPTSATANVSGANANLTGGTIPSNRGLDLNPNDIESITVLKGPAATALYGIRAASGALIITTKRGVAGQKMRVDFSSTTSSSSTNQLPELQDKYSQGSNGIYRAPNSGNSNRRITWGAALDTLSWDGVSNEWDPHGNIVGKSSPLAKIPVTPYDRYEFFKTGLALDNNIAISGSTERSAFRASIGNIYQEGVIPKTKYSKTSFSLNGQMKLTDKLNISGSMTYINSNNDKVQQGSNVSGVMLGLLRTPPNFDNSWGLSNAQDDERAYVIASTGDQRNYRGGAGYDNPYWTVNRNPFNEIVNRVFGNLQTNYQIADWIGLSYRFGGDVYSQDAKNFYDINSNAFRAGKGIINEYFNNQYVSDFTINLKHTFSSDLSGTLLLGHNYFYTQSSGRTAIGDALIAPKFFDLSNALTYTGLESDAAKRTMAFYGDAELAYRKMLYLSLTGRRETSSTLPENNRNFFYPSAGLTWLFSELPALKDKFLTYGKLRLSYAQVGKDAPVFGDKTYYRPGAMNDGFTSGILFPINNGSPIGGYQITSTISVIGNSDLKPEKTSSYEVGAELGFLKSRINFTGTYYYSKTVDAIFTVPFTYTTGFASKLQNAGEITNHGFELSLNTTPVKTNDLTWDLNFNWALNRNMVTKLYTGVDKVLVAGFQNGEIDAFEGKPFGQIFGSVYVRANASSSTTSKELPSGQLLINDNTTDNGYAMPIVAAQNAIMGDINPDWQGSVINNLTWKGLSFGFQIDVRQGGAIWNGTRGALSYFGTSKETENRGSSKVFTGLKGHLNASGAIVHFDANGNEVSGPGDANTTSAVLNQYYWQNIGSSFIGPSEPSVEDGSFVKLRQVSLGYNFPKSLVGKKFRTLNITVFANNILIHTNYKGVDPETSLAGPANGQGLDYFNNPGIKTYGVRLNVGL
ncbi:SusC/RagA family TonB-linked outer membrane protein [Flavihumibacter profundi]|uniref:SusC/RagA family TonB-linked outer membrane protein n=1 Tax=Flavihumibacter profundi TaxID=2716883 RepID=UPI001CC43895|nr:SusC/RagA family TonB-linked outer membrane protein [Flavihumibacter profundi]MBZ5859407.1 SusC/RagA family TonB-linked outer membrane protein [Flavihumibacter profundi]